MLQTISNLPFEELLLYQNWSCIKPRRHDSSAIIPQMEGLEIALNIISIGKYKIHNVYIVVIF